MADFSLKSEEIFALNDLLKTGTDKLVNFAIQLAVAVLVFYVGRFVIRKVVKIIKRLMDRRKVDASIASFVNSALETVLYFILIIAIVGILGIETSSFIALFASAGVAIGMALSGTLQNFAGGVLILSLRPYSVGDFIETQGYSGTVKAIQMFHTVITTPDNKTIIIPNGPLSNGNINNYSRQPDRRVDWTISLAYGTDFEKAKAAILDILASIPEIDRKTPGREPVVVIASLTSSSIDLAARVWVRSEDYWTVYNKVLELIYSGLPAQGFKFPFTQMDVHLVPTDGKN